MTDMRDPLAQSKLFTDAAITSFSGEHRFLSNFYVGEPLAPRGPWWDPGVVAVFPSVEHAFQAAKVEPGAPRFVEHYKRIALAGIERFEGEGRGSPDPGLAKHLGSRKGFEQAGATLRRDWDYGTKVLVMLACLRAKFAYVANWDEDEPLWRFLVNTSPRVLVEGNTWGDTYWGVCNGSGKNMLGRLLMLVRAELLAAVAAGMRPEDLR